MDDIVNDTNIAVGVADIDNTFGHIKLQDVCLEKDIKPIFGVRLMVIKKKIPKTKIFGPHYIFIARNIKGLQEIYRLVELAYNNFYYHPFITLNDVQVISKNVIVITDNFESQIRVDYIALTTTTPTNIAEIDIPKVAINFNYFPTPEDRQTYELFTGGKNFSYTEAHTFQQHILSDDEFMCIWDEQEALDNTYVIANMCDNIKIPFAKPIQYKGITTIESLCNRGMKKRGVEHNLEYKKRMQHELSLIKKKNFGDYFLVVAELIKNTKTQMLVGPSRGSSAGSLVCYLLGITEIDPIKYNLLFERFIDINRSDLPDIDIDFPDVTRQQVIKSLVNRYGEDHVKHIGTISKMKAKSAIGEFASELGIPSSETEDVKNDIIEHPPEHERKNKCIEDTFNSTVSGQNFIDGYPEMRLAENIENHARHSGVHAAGIIICNDKLTQYAGVNNRDNVLMLDHKEAKSIGLLKIDCLGLRTLSILQECAELAGFDFHDYYTLDPVDKKVFDIFNKGRFSGIFQFEGWAVKHFASSITIKCFEDLSDLIAIARPGPMQVGGADLFINRKNKNKAIEYISDHPVIKKHTKATQGIIVYQEQFMSICREYAKMSWSDINKLRKAIGYKLGSDYLDKFKDDFIKADKNASKVWRHMIGFGEYGFNRSHSISYALIAYWCAWAKLYHPLEFAAATLNNIKDEESAVRVLRDMVQNDNIEYTAFDPDKSKIKWSIIDGKLLGGITNIKGIGPRKAKDIIDCRAGRKEFNANMINKLRYATTIFDDLFQCKTFWGHFYEEPEENGLEEPPSYIKDIHEPGDYIFIGKLIKREIHDLNKWLIERGETPTSDNPLSLNMQIEDDTDAINCNINRYKFGRFVKRIGVEGTWYLIAGSVNEKRRVNITGIKQLKQEHYYKDIPF